MNGKVGQVDIKGLRSMQNIAGYAASLCIPKYYHQPPSSRGEQGGGTIREFYIYSTTELERNVIYKKEFKKIYLSL